MINLMTEKCYPMSLKTGLVLSDTYKIVSLIGEGGYGSVYKAWNLVRGDFCTIKQYSSVTSQSLDQYQLEAEILKDVNHPCLPKVLGYFLYEDNFMLVTEYVEGIDLKKVVSKNGPMLAEQACAIIKQVGLALDYLHTEFIYPLLHRDVKPSNIILRGDGGVTLIDFGLMKFDRGQFTTTAARSVTTGFSPIEQYSQEEQLRTDVRSDVYSLGATLFFLLTVENPQESIARSWKDLFGTAIKQRSDIPKSLVKVISKSMAVLQDKRYPNVREFINAIDGYLEVNSIKPNSALGLEGFEIRSDFENYDEISLENFIKPEDTSKNEISSKHSESEYSLILSSVKDKDSGFSFLKRERSPSGKVFVKLSLPNDLKEVIIRKSYWKFPEDHFDGENVQSLSVKEGFCELVDQVHTGPVYYTFFGKYKNKRKAIVTREIARIDL